MTDFVAEFRPRLRPQTVFEHPEGFVAEFRPRRMNTIPEESEDPCHKGLIVPRPTDDPCSKSKLGLFSKEDAPSANSDYSDSDLLNALSEKKFSKESITQLLENSIITLVGKLLINRPIHRIQGSIRVLLNDDDSPIILDLNKQFTKSSNGNYDYLTELDSGFNVKLRDELARESEARLTSECGTPGDMHGAGCMQVGAVSPPLDAGFREDDARPMCSPPSGPDILSHHGSVSDAKTPQHHREAKKRRRDSDDESGYTSRDDLDCNVEESAEKLISKRSEASNQHRMFNEYFCNGFDGSETLYNPENGRPSDDTSDCDRSGSSAEGSDEMDDDLVRESRLIIDENPGHVSDAFPSMDIRECISSANRNHNFRFQENLKTSEYLKSKPLHELSSESEEFESLISSDITDVDTDAPVDISGDSDMSRGMSAVLPHPQSLVTKHLDGLKCKQCSLIIADGEAVSEHALTNHNLFSCSFCYRTFTAKNNLKRHVRLHTGARPYKCAQCPQTFARRDDLKGHVLRHDYSKPFRCSICHKGYTDRACVKNHMAKEHRSRLMHVCPSCGESFDRDESFTQHKKSHPELQQFSCRKCSFIGTNNLMTLKHNLLHTHKLFSCKPCNAYFSDPFDYTTHVRKHKKVLSFTQYICCFCNFSLATYDQYVRHEYSHAQGKTHTCKLCKKQFKNKSLLNEHCHSHQETHASNTSNESEKASISSEKATVPIPTEAAARPAPEIPQIMTEEADYDEYHGQLLDLSMKKPSSPDFGGSFESRQRVNGLIYDIPRNGYVIKPFTQRSEAQAATPYKPAPAVEEKTYRPVFNVRHENILTSGLKQDLRFPQKTSPMRADKQSCSDKTAPQERLTLNHGYSGNVGNRGALRFAPYNVQKMLEFANKYIAARGPKIGSKVALNLNPESPEALLPISEARKDSGVQNVSRTSAEDWRQSTKDLNADPCGALPTVIKSELATDSDMEEASNGSHAVTRSPSHHHSADAHIPFEAHEDTEAGKPHHTCDLCKDSFRSFNDLEAHSVDAHKRYLCEHCMKTFTTRPNRDRHARVHTGERPYKCDLCELAFFRGDDLKYHRTTRHPSAQPYVCPRCSVSFTWGRDLERHIRHSKCKA